MLIVGALFGPGGNRDLKPVSRLGPLRGQPSRAQFLNDRYVASSQLASHHRRHRTHGEPDEPRSQGFGDAWGECQCPAVSQPPYTPLGIRRCVLTGEKPRFCQDLAPRAIDLIAGMAFWASSSVSKPITAANFRPITWAMKKAILTPAAAIPCAIL